MRRSISTTLVLAAALTASWAFSSRQDWSSRHIHTPTTATRSRLFGWSQEATVFYDDDDDDDDVSNKAHPRVSLDDCSSTVVTTTEGITLHLSSPREWLEHDGSPDGAYTVMRCDLHGSINSSTPSETAAVASSDATHHNWHLWGLDFHLHRLVESLECYAQSEGSSAVDVGMDSASRETRLVIDALLTETALELSPVLAGVSTGAGENSKHICVAMVTILWSPDPKSDGTMVRVKGHVCSSGIPTDPTEYDPDLIHVALALPSPSTDSDISISSLPSRKDSFPEAKLSAWCNKRRPLEVQFKTEGVGEVLLVDKNGGEGDAKGAHIQLLEGLTSNLFVLYPDDVLRTAGTGVLHGYARQQVLAQAVRLGLTLDLDTPIRLDESDMWLECFVTSSVKLIAPVGRIMVPVTTGGEDGNGTTNELEEVWSRGNVANARSVWRELYNGIILDH
jgi:hypothetical protein